jgi:hypothetical protein
VGLGCEENLLISILLLSVWPKARNEKPLGTCFLVFKMGAENTARTITQVPGIYRGPANRAYRLPVRADPVPGSSTPTFPLGHHGRDTAPHHLSL